MSGMTLRIDRGVGRDTPIDFWFDFASPYGYFMSEKIDALASRHGRSVRWRPVLLFAVLRALGLPAPLGHAVKRDYMQQDFARSARFLNLPYVLPEGFPATTQHAARAFYLLQQEAPESAVPFAHRALRGYFQGGEALGALAQVADRASALAPQVGDAQAWRARLAGDDAKALLARAVDEAVEANVFGSPFVVIDGEAFFGVDRLPQIEARLAGRLPATPLTVTAHDHFLE
jgi:2-hydroxychromene-2-carboxylate isomerase